MTKRMAGIVLLSCLVGLATVAPLHASLALAKNASEAPGYVGGSSGPQRPSQSPRQPVHLSPKQVYQRVVNSIFLVLTLDDEEKVIALGSGVAVSADQVVTNVHVVEGGVYFQIDVNGKRRFPAYLTHLDVDHDLCKLRVEGLGATPVSVRDSESLEVGDRVYALGNPEGFRYTFSEGLVSAIRPDATGQGIVVQTTAPISHGSSGGGLFDDQARLVGITRLTSPEGQNLNFAVETKWVLALDSHPAVQAGGSSAGTHSGLGLQSFQIPKRQTPEPGAQNSDAQKLFQAGHRAYEAGDYDEAIEAFRKGIRLLPEDPWAHYELGLALEQKHQYDGAFDEFNRALRLAPDFAEARQRAAIVKQAQADVHAGRGSALDLNGDIKGAIVEYREALRICPDHAYVHAVLGGALERTGDRNGAIAELREAIRIRPGDANTHGLLGGVLEEKGDLEGAIAEFREEVRLEPDSAFSRISLGNALLTKGDMSGAIAEYREAVRLEPNWAVTHVFLAGALDQKGDHDGAIYEYAKVLQLNPDADVHAQLGLALVGKGDLDGAVAQFQEALRQNPDDASALGALGAVAELKGDLDTAIKYVRNALRANPDLAEAHVLLGSILEQRGEKKAALDEYRTAHLLAPDNPAYREAYEQLLRTLGQ